MTPRTRALTCGVGAVLLGASALAAFSPASAAPRKVVLSHTRPTWLSRATSLGAARAGARVSARIYLTPRGGTAALESAVKAVSTPGSASYGHYLTTAQYAQRYAPTTATVRAVEAHATAAGLTITGVGAGRSYIGVSGDVAAANKAFSVNLRRYRHDGHTVQAPSTAVKLPSSIGSLVSSVTGLDTTPHRMTPDDATPIGPPAGYRNVTPGCSAYYGQMKPNLPAFQGRKLPSVVCGYTGRQLRGAYLGGGSVTQGKGVTVAIIDAYASPTIASDIVKYAAKHGDAVYGPGQFTQNTLPASRYTDTSADACDASGWYGEETLDIEAVHALAQGANVRFYAGASCNDIDLIDAFYRVLDENTASIVSNSFGEAELQQDPSVTPVWHTAVLQAALQGISVMASSADDGDYAAATATDQDPDGTVQTSLPAADPAVTAVGGTSTAIDSRNVLVGQTGWGTDKWTLAKDGKSWTSAGFLYGSGGGTSLLYSKPWYQKSVSTGGDGRGVPDVAMVGDPSTGFLVGQTQTFTDGTYYDESRYGGTSLSSPLFAAMTAVKIANTGGGRLGFLNPAIYAKASQFRDVLNPLDSPGVARIDFTNGENAKGGYTYSVRTFNNDSSLAIAKGWDDVTGLGSPTVAWTRQR